MKSDKQRQIRKTFFLLLFSLLVSIKLHAQSSNSGKEFYVAFGRNETVTAVLNLVGGVVPSNSVDLILRITSHVNSTVTLSFTENSSYDVVLPVNAGQILDYNLTVDQARAVYSGSSGKTSKSVHITATEPITLVAMCTTFASYEATLVWPVDAWGTEYYNLGIPPNTGGHGNGYVIIAKENGTVITGNVNTTLDAGDVYFAFVGNTNYYGHHIVSDKPIAFFNNISSGMLTFNSVNRYNYNFEQYLPVKSWGKEFILPTTELINVMSPSGPVMENIYARIFAKEANTNVTVIYTNGTTAPYTLGAGGSQIITINSSNNSGATACYISSDKPIGICAHFIGNPANTYAWQPSEAWLPPLEQKTRNVLISPLDFNAVHVNQRVDHYFSIIVPTANKNSTTVSINGGPVQPIQNLIQSAQNNPGFMWIADNIGGSDYSFGRYYFGPSIAYNGTLLNTTILVDNPEGLVALTWGQGNYASYFYTVGSDYKDLTAGFTVNGKYYYEMDGDAYCYEKNFILEAYPDTLTSILWTLNDVEIPGSADDLIVYLNNLPDGYYTINMFTHDTDHITHFFVGGSPVIWTPENNINATSLVQLQDWNNSANWTPVLIPTNCHNVFISGVSISYPNLTSNVACKNIYFIQGAELGRPDLLFYEKAFVQLNFDLKQNPPQQMNSNQDLVLKSSSTLDRMKYSAAVSADPLSRERCYLLSSPLHGVVTGDLCFGGFPLTYLMKFGPVNKDNIHYPVGSWTTPYTSMTDSVSTNVTDGFAYYMYGYGGPYANKPNPADNAGCYETGLYATLNDMDFLPSNRSALNYGLKETNGIIELPFFADSTGLYAHRTQVYNSASNTSVFYSINDGQANPLEFNMLTGKQTSVNREAFNDNYRFIPETRIGADRVFPPTIYHSGAGIGGNEDFLVGNPLMSSINMVNFITQNLSTLQNMFRIWNGSTYIDYEVIGADIISPVMGDVNPGLIAPWQAFILRSEDGFDGNGNVAFFDVGNISVVRSSGNSNLRSSTADENILRIKAENSFAASYMLIGYNENADNAFRKGADVQKLFTFLDHVPEIYALAGETPASIRFINDKREVIVPLGIKTTQTGEINLTFTGMDNYTKATKIELIDAFENRTIDLTRMPSYTYTFINSETGIRNGRFSIRIENSITALPDVIDSDYLKVYNDSKGIYVVSSSNDPVKQIIVYDLQGRKIYENSSNANFYPIKGNRSNSPLIVKVITKKQVKTVKLMIND